MEVILEEIFYDVLLINLFCIISVINVMENNSEGKIEI